MSDRFFCSTAERDQRECATPLAVMSQVAVDEGEFLAVRPARGEVLRSVARKQVAVVDIANVARLPAYLGDLVISHGYAQFAKRRADGVSSRGWCGSMPRIASCNEHSDPGSPIVTAS